MGDLIDFEAFRQRKMEGKDPEELICYTDLNGELQGVLRGQPVTFGEWNLMPPWLKGLYHCPSV